MAKGSLQPHSLQTFAIFCVYSGVPWQPDLSVYAIIPKVIRLYPPDLESNGPAASRL